MPHMYKHCCYRCEKELSCLSAIEVDIDDDFVDFVLMCQGCYAYFCQQEQDMHGWETAMSEKRKDDV